MPCPYNIILGGTRDCRVGPIILDNGNGASAVICQDLHKQTIKSLETQEDAYCYPIDGNMIFLSHQRIQKIAVGGAVSSFGVSLIKC